MSTVEIVLSTLKDAVGLNGTVLIAIPFFRLEGLKRRAARIGAVETGSDLSASAFAQVQAIQKDLMFEPSELDFRATLLGLALVASSFALSIVLPFVPAIVALVQRILR